MSPGGCFRGWAMEGSGRRKGGRAGRSGDGGGRTGHGLLRIVRTDRKNLVSLKTLTKFLKSKLLVLSHSY